MFIIYLLRLRRHQMTECTDRFLATTNFAVLWAKVAEVTKVTLKTWLSFLH